MKYDDILDVPYPFKTDRPRMSLYDRAFQFAPFAALTGYDALIDETSRLTAERFETGENTKYSNHEIQIIDSSSAVCLGMHKE